MATARAVEARLSCRQPQRHLVDVTLVIPPASAPGPRTLWMPRWIPGSYKIRDFARFVQDVEVRDRKGRRLTVARDTTDGWTFRDPAQGPLTVSYQVYCRDLTVDTSHVTATHLYVHGVTAFLYDDHLVGGTWRVTLDLPAGWKVWSGLPRERPAGKNVVLLAENYDQLVDCPIEAGRDHKEVKFKAAGKPHALVVWNPPEDVDWKKVGKDLAKLVEETAALFGGLPYDNYTFIAHVGKGYGGGLEHKNSTVLGVDPLHLTDAKLYGTRFIPLVAHEFFHVWNVRRIQPAAFHPFDYQREVLTSLLWLFEGGTSYYEIPLLLRAKIVKDEHVYETLADMMKALEAVPGRFRLSAGDASRLTWVKLYQRHECNINTNVSYYSKGALVCLCLDAHLRKKGKSLDVVMRHLWKHYGARSRGVPEDGFASIVKDATGIDVSRELRAWVDTPGDLPVDAALKTLGVKVERKHGEPEAKLGLGIHVGDDNLRVTAVADRWPTKTGRPRGRNQQPLAPAIDPDDEIVAVDGWKVTNKDLSKFVNRKKKGEKIALQVFRDGKLTAVEATVYEKEPDKVKLSEDKKAGAAAKRRRAGWKRALAKK